MTESQPAPETTNAATQDRRPAGPELRRTQTIAGAALLLTVLPPSAPRGTRSRATSWTSENASSRTSRIRRKPGHSR